MWGYLNASILVEVLKRSGPKPTPAGIAAAIERMADVDIGGFRLGYEQPETPRLAVRRNHHGGPQRQVRALTLAGLTAGRLDPRVARASNAGGPVLYSRQRSQRESSPGARGGSRPGRLCRVQPLCVPSPVLLPIGLRGGRNGRRKLPRTRPTRRIPTGTPIRIAYPYPYAYSHPYYYNYYPYYYNRYPYYYNRWSLRLWAWAYGWWGGSWHKHGHSHRHGGKGGHGHGGKGGHGGGRRG